MANRTTSQQQALLASLQQSTVSAPSTGSYLELFRITSLSFDYAKGNENISTFGQSAPIDRKATSSPDISMSFSYYVVDFNNEKRLGFDIATSTQANNSALASILGGTTDNKNYFNPISPEGADIIGEDAAALPSRAIGNGFINSYSVNGSVGGFVEATVDVQGLNMVAYADGTTQVVPAVDPETGVRSTNTFTLPVVHGGHSNMPSSIGQGDISVSIASGSAPFQEVSGSCIQSFDISMDLGREDLNCIGSRFAKSREVTYPIDVTVTIDAFLDDLTTGAFEDFICDDTGYDIEVQCRKPQCGGVGAVQAQYTVRNAKLESASYSQGVGDNETVSVTYIGSVGGSGDTVNGIAMSGLVDNY